MSMYIWKDRVTESEGGGSLSLPFSYPAEYDDWLLEWPPGKGQGFALGLLLCFFSLFLPQNKSKRLTTLLWLCEGNELHLVTDRTGHLKPDLLTLKGPAILELISTMGVKGVAFILKIKDRPDGNMSAPVLSILLQAAYQSSISAAGEKGQIVRVGPQLLARCRHETKTASEASQ